MDYLISYNSDGTIKGFFVIDYPGAVRPTGDFVTVSKQEYDRVFDDGCTHYIDGKFVRVETPILPEHRAEYARRYRNSLLSKTDWTQMPDIPAAYRTKWAEYRQMLRDVTAQSEFPENIVWPVAPSEQN